MVTTAKNEKVKGRVVIFDDEPGMGQILVKTLDLQGFETKAFSNPLEGMEALGDLQPDVLLTDVRMPKMNGLKVLDRMRGEFPDVVVLAFTAYGTVEGAVEAMQAGAFNYITKPFDQGNLLAQIGRAIKHRHMLQENLRLSEKFSDNRLSNEIIGKSMATQQVREMIARAAPTDASVLITGASGVGKELIARSIHVQSQRGRFVTINCPSIPPSLIESEIFGHERGAFTGADRSKMGLIELAQGGTLFLDEIAELPSEMQVKLLRVLQEHEIQRVGGLKQIPVDLRLIAATNRNLRDEMSEGRFREDLFFRLNVIQIEILPLKNRREDIVPIAKHFLKRLEREMMRPGLSLSQAAMDMLKGYNWPGNVRELENALERAAVLSGKQLIEVEDLTLDLRRNATFPISNIQVSDSNNKNTESLANLPIEYRQARNQFERRYLTSLIERAEGNISRAAQLSGISRRNLYDKLGKVGLTEGMVKKR